jgi:hypothetical protein
MKGMTIVDCRLNPLPIANCQLKTWWVAQSTPYAHFVDAQTIQSAISSWQFAMDSIDNRQS